MQHNLFRQLERAHKLVLICEKIRKTMNGPAKVIIDNSRGEYVLLESQAVVHGVMTTAGVKAVQYVVMPEDLLLGRWGPKSDRLLGDVWTPQSCDELHRFRIADVVKADIRWAAGQIHGISVSSSDYQNVHPLV